MDTTLTYKHWIALLAAIATMLIQLFTGSLPLGAMVGLSVMFITQAVKWSDMDKILDGGVS